ncbi:MFS transporter [Streptomyces sp. NPDC002623]
MRGVRPPGRGRAASAVPRLGWAARLRAAGAPMTIRPFRRHVVARMLSWTGSAVSPIGLAFAVLHVGGGATGLGWVLAAGTAPQILLLLVGGVVADRWSRARAMLWTNVVSAVAEAAAALLLLTGAAQVWHLVAMSAVCGAASAFFIPAAGGVVVEVVPAEVRHQVNALLKVGQNVVKVGGPALGGLLVAAVGPSWVIGWDAVMFAVAALCVRLGLGPAKAKIRGGFTLDVRQGWADFASRRWLWVMVLQGAVVVPVWLAGYQLLGPVYGRDYLGGCRSVGRRRQRVHGRSGHRSGGGVDVAAGSGRVGGVRGYRLYGFAAGRDGAGRPGGCAGGGDCGCGYGPGGEHDGAGESGAGAHPVRPAQLRHVLRDSGADRAGAPRLPGGRAAGGGVRGPDGSWGRCGADQRGDGGAVAAV